MVIVGRVIISGMQIDQFSGVKYRFFHRENARIDGAHDPGSPPLLALR
jgi:hypothetical protein